MRVALVALGLLACGSPSGTGPGPAPTVAVVPVEAGAPIAPVVAPAPPPATISPSLLPECTDVAVVVSLDRSGSMTGLPMDESKKAIAALVDTLHDHDCIGVTAFDSAATTFVKLGLAVDKQPIKASIDRLIAGGGTDILSGLVAAHEMIKPANRAKTRLVILLSDGQSPAKGLVERAHTMSDEKIIVSTVALGAGADKKLLGTISDAADGHLYTTQDPTQLTRIFVRELDLFRKTDSGY